MSPSPALQQEARQRNIRSEDGVRSEIRALGRGELLRPGNIVAFGTTMDAAEPCPIISDEWHLLDDVPPHESAVLDLDLQSGGSGVRGSDATDLIPRLANCHVAA